MLERKLKLKISQLHLTMELETKELNNCMGTGDWSCVAIWNHKKKSTAKALRKFLSVQ